MEPSQADRPLRSRYVAAPAVAPDAAPGTAVPSTPSALGFLDGTLVVIFVLANMVHMTGLLLPLSPFSVPVAMAVQYGVLAIYGVVALLRGHVVVLGLGAAWIGYLLFQCYVWHQITGLPINFNAILTYGTVLAFLMFYETRVSPRFVLRLLLGLATGYLVIYALFWQQIIDIVGRDSTIFLPSDGERGNRMYLAAPFAVLVLMYGFSVLRLRPFIAVGAIVLSGYVMFLAQSRFALAVLAISIGVAFIGSIALELRRGANITLAVVFVLLAAFTLSGFFLPGTNPYELTSSDGSGAARALEYRDGLAALRGHFLTGFGIAASNDDLQLYVRPARPFFVSDIGMAGLAMQFGLILVALLTYLSVRFMTTLPAPPNEMDPLYYTLFYTIQWSAFGTLVSPLILGGPGTVFAAITVALWMRRRATADAAVPAPV